MAVNNKQAFDDLRDNVEPAADDQTTQHDERLVFRTDHLRNYKELDDLIALEGKDYKPIKKAALRYFMWVTGNPGAPIEDKS